MQITETGSAAQGEHTVGRFMMDAHDLAVAEPREIAKGCKIGRMFAAVMDGDLDGLAVEIDAARILPCLFHSPGCFDLQL